MDIRSRPGRVDGVGHGRIGSLHFLEQLITVSLGLGLDDALLNEVIPKDGNKYTF